MNIYVSLMVQLTYIIEIEVKSNKIIEYLHYFFYISRARSILENEK